MVTSAPRPEGGAPLTRDAIVQRALDLLDRHGVEWLSMRKLAAELGVSAQALYWHFASKDALCEAVVAAAAGELRAIPLGRGSVDARLQRYCLGLRAHWRRHPSAIELGRRYAPTAGGAVAEQGVDLLREWGFPEATVHDRHRALVWAVLGFVHVEQGVSASAHHRPLDDAGRRYEVQLADPEAPTRELDADQLFHDLVGLVIGGLRAELDRPPTVPGQVARRGRRAT